MWIYPHLAFGLSLLIFSKTQDPYASDEGNNSTCMSGLQRRLNEIK